MIMMHCHHLAEVNRSFPIGNHAVQYMPALNFVVGLILRKTVLLIASIERDLSDDAPGDVHTYSENLKFRRLPPICAV